MLAMIDSFQEEDKGEGVMILWTAATASYQKLSGSLRTGRQAKKLLMLSLDSMACIGYQQKEEVEDK